MPLLQALIIDDSDDDAVLIVRHIRRGGHEVSYDRVDTPVQMRSALESQRWDVIISDYTMPHFSGMGALEVYHQSGLDIPFIMVSGTIGEETAVAALKAGAHDFVLKSNLARLVPAIERELREVVVRRARHQAEERLRHAAYHDALTGLANRVLFQERLQVALDDAKAGAPPFAVLFIDLDRMRVIVDSLGHGAGDRLCVEAGLRLKGRVEPQGGLVARLGGDDFAVLLGQSSEDAAVRCAEALQQDLARPFRVGEIEVYTTATIGVVLYSESYEHAEEILRDADTANHRAKQLGKGRFEIFTRAMYDRAVSLLALETKLRRALDNRQFHLFYQPIVNLDDGRLAGFEALVRWRDEDSTVFSPSEFVPLTEETGLIIPIGRWVLLEACRQMRAWHQAFPHRAALNISVNLSVRQFAQPDLVADIDRILAETGLPAEALKLEITESVLMENPDAAQAILEDLRARKIKLLMDDFGTGFSSLSYLHRFPVNTIKIDASFVKKMDVDPRSAGIVQSVVSLASTLDTDVIAEGVETVRHMELLQILGVRYGQGYLFSRPLDSEAATRLLAGQATQELPYIDAALRLAD